MKNFVLLFLISCLFLNCANNSQFIVLKKIDSKPATDGPQFSLVSDSQTFITFQNTIKETKTLNFLNNANIYNGGGVATADFNNDGLTDVYFIANQKSNKLYLNKGDFKFEDITKTAGVEDAEGWSTGVSVVDINNDGWFDIYVCKSGSFEDNMPKVNKLYVNQKDNTFIEMAEKWRVNDSGFSTQSYFLDFDKDGDLDMYLVNHRSDFHNTSSLDLENDSYFSKDSSDKLYRNDGEFFTEITHSAGMVNKAWGLSASIGDFNGDNWPDVYVCNDFISPDMLYINNQDGTFSNQILNIMNHVSFSSMGSDFADINNDLLPDLMVLEMVPEDHIRSKRNMASMNTSSFKYMVKVGYHHQYMLNTLQLNQGNGIFKEISQMSGLSKTDWSWAPLIADFNNDGFKDIFITNGILKEMGDQDFRNSLDEKFKQMKKPNFEEVTSMLPSNKQSNYCFKNNRDYTFSNVAKKWGLDAKSHSNGVAYADFDNDGDLDLVINNINDKAQIYRNNDANNFIQIKLNGDKKNKFAIGSKITITVKDNKQYQELYLSRGFLSSTHNSLNFGIGNETSIDEILIEWPNEQITSIKDVEANQIISINQKNSVKSNKPSKEDNETLITKINPTEKGISFKHKERQFDDFKNQILLPHSQSQNGPFITKADVNSDGLEDFFVGGAAGQPGELYIQSVKNNFVKQQIDLWINDKDYEDLGVLFFDADNDNDQDLYVVSGSSEFPEKSNMFQDRLYLNDGSGNFANSKNKIPLIDSSGQCVKASDIDKDGDLDLFIGGRVIPDKYPYAPESYILINDGGKFYNKTSDIAPLLKNIGMITDATFSDYDKDGDEDLIVVGEWMPITIFENLNGVLELKFNESIKDTEGLWFNIASNDIDNDGDIDYFVGNLGLNTKFKASKEKPFHIFCDDFDSSGTYDIVLTSNYKGTLVPSRGRECSLQQMPFIKDKFPSFKSFAEASLEDVYGKNKLEEALHYETIMLESVFLENLGNGEFNIKKFPKSVQISPIMDFDFIDIDNNNSKEIVIVGNHYNTEVETVRYDASFGSILSYKEGEFIVNDPNSTGFVNKGNAKNIAIINSEDKKLILVTNNNNSLQVFKLN